MATQWQFRMSQNHLKIYLKMAAILDVQKKATFVLTFSK